MNKTNHVPVIASVVVAVVFGYSINSWFSTNLSAFAVDRVAAQAQDSVDLAFSRITHRHLPGNLYRARICGGWLVGLVPTSSAQNSCLVFIPDPNHDWDGNSMPDPVDKETDVSDTSKAKNDAIELWRHIHANSGENAAEDKAREIFFQLRAMAADDATTSSIVPDLKGKTVIIDTGFPPVENVTLGVIGEREFVIVPITRDDGTAFDYWKPLESIHHLEVFDSMEKAAEAQR